jgi:hypothetical protein
MEIYEYEKSRKIEVPFVKDVAFIILYWVLNQPIIPRFIARTSIGWASYG